MWRQVDTLILNVSGAANWTIANLLQPGRSSGMRILLRLQEAKEFASLLYGLQSFFGLLPLAWVDIP
jgi:hypothetical protein